MNYKKYQESRDLSWEILCSNQVKALPVPISQICKTMNYKLLTYTKGEALIQQFNLHNNTENNDGFTLSNVIFYNDKCSIARQRFTVAHELGHCLLHDGKGLYNREPSPNDNPIEQEANVFASRLLAPACVLWGMNVTTPEQIADICNISIQSAEFRMERMKTLYKRGKFLVSPLECAVYEQFREYIAENRI